MEHGAKRFGTSTRPNGKVQKLSAGAQPRHLGLWEMSKCIAAIAEVQALGISSGSQGQGFWTSWTCQLDAPFLPFFDARSRS